MAIPKEITDYLARRFVTYSHKIHPLAYTSQEVAAADHIPGGELAKTVMVKADGRLMMTVLPADHVIDMKTLKARIGCDKLTLASERDFRERFVPCLTGAMPPFGRLFGFTVLCDRTLAEKPEIEFNAGTHIDTIRMSFWKFVQMETPVMTDFSEKATGKWRARAA